MNPDRPGEEGSISVAEKNGNGLIRIRYGQSLLASKSKGARDNLDGTNAGGRAAAEREQASAGAKQNVYLVGLIVDYRQIRFAVIVEVTADYACRKRAGRIKLTTESNVGGRRRRCLCERSQTEPCQREG